MIRGLNSGDVESCLVGLQSYLSGIPSNLHVKLKAYYHSIFYTVFQLVGTRIQVEVHVRGSRADAIVETAMGIYVFEFKYNQSPEIALEQIKTKGYYRPYMDHDKNLVMIGLNFKEVGGLEWVIEGSAPVQCDEMGN